MHQINTNILKHRINEFERRHSNLSPGQSERELIDILIPLFQADGYRLEHTSGAIGGSVDYLAYRNLPGDEIPVAAVLEYKHYRPLKKITVNDVRALVGGAVLRQYDRVILLTNADLTHAAGEELEHVLPFKFQLMNVDSLRAWARRIERAQKDDISPIVQLVIELSEALARKVAECPRYLDEIEWRDMERMLASIFDRLGFDVKLTPPAKDGGKDLILTCLELGEGKKYFVEVKHWRSGKGVGIQKVRNFVHVLATEQVDHGLYLATYGYTGDAIEALSASDRLKLKFGQEPKIISLCQTFVRAESGIWSPPKSLSEVLFEGTV